MTDTTGEILHLLRPVEDAERPPHVDSGQHRVNSQAGLASIVRADAPAPGTVRVTLDLTPEQIKALVDVLDSGQQAIGDTTDRMEGEEYGYYDDEDRATQRAFREAADAVVAVAMAALDAARQEAGL
ncbi:hypothetical protein ABRQ22_14810 [Cellulosimicrobium sp. ES-005]|uniref:Uncharacterized protein n=1 Tax=Cellulosimicrobium sp. ES-005 TaxID=3163031 RepID=A0AAU8FWJ8_9MICO